METPDLFAQFAFSASHFGLALKKCSQRPRGEVCLTIRFDEPVAGLAPSPIADALAHDAVEHISSERAAG